MNWMTSGRKRISNKRRGMGRGRGRVPVRELASPSPSSSSRKRHSLSSAFPYYHPYTSPSPRPRPRTTFIPTSYGRGLLSEDVVRLRSHFDAVRHREAMDEHRFRSQRLEELDENNQLDQEHHQQQQQQQQQGSRPPFHQQLQRHGDDTNAHPYAATNDRPTSSSSFYKPGALSKHPLRQNQQAPTTAQLPLAEMSEIEEFNQNGCAAVVVPNQPELWNDGVRVSTCGAALSRASAADGIFVGESVLGYLRQAVQGEKLSKNTLLEIQSMARNDGEKRIEEAIGNLLADLKQRTTQEENAPSVFAPGHPHSAAAGSCSLPAKAYSLIDNRASTMQFRSLQQHSPSSFKSAISSWHDEVSSWRLFGGTFAPCRTASNHNEHDDCSSEPRINEPFVASASQSQNQFTVAVEDDSIPAEKSKRFRRLVPRGITGSQESITDMHTSCPLLSPTPQSPFASNSNICLDSPVPKIGDAVVGGTRLNLHDTSPETFDNPKLLPQVPLRDPSSINPESIEGAHSHRSISPRRDVNPLSDYNGSNFREHQLPLGTPLAPLPGKSTQASEFLGASAKQNYLDSKSRTPSLPDSPLYSQPCAVKNDHASDSLNGEPAPGPLPSSHKLCEESNGERHIVDLCEGDDPCPWSQPISVSSGDSVTPIRNAVPTSHTGNLKESEQPPVRVTLSPSPVPNASQNLSRSQNEEAPLLRYTFQRELSEDQDRYAPFDISGIENKGGCPPFRCFNFGRRGRWRKRKNPLAEDLVSSNTWLSIMCECLKMQAREQKETA